MEQISPDIRIKLRDEQAHCAARALFAAATLCMVRAIILPWLTAHSPAGAFPGGADVETMRLAGVGLAAFFALLAFWAANDPLPAAVTALTCYIALSVPDILNNSGLLAQGLISKFVMIMTLGRALFAAVLHRLN
jgi:hypothetical protein